MSARPMDWKNALAVAAWKHEHKEKFKDKKPCASSPGLDANEWAQHLVERIFRTEGSVDLHGPEFENILDRAHRLERGGKKPRGPQRKGKKFLVPPMLERGVDGEWVYHPMLKRQDAAILEKGRCLYESGLVAKAYRQAACGIVGGKVI